MNLLIFALAALTGALYAIVIYAWRYFDRDHGMAAMWVVGGNLLVAGFMALLYGVEVAAMLIALFAVMGIWQILGYHVDRILMRRKEAQRLEF